MAGKASQGKTPKLVVFDLDMCVWEPEMYTLNKIPTPADAVRGDSGEGEQVRPLPPRTTARRAWLAQPCCSSPMLIPNAWRH